MDGRARPIRVKFNHEDTARDMINSSWKLKEKVALQNLKIRKFLDEEERKRLRTLLDWVKGKNAKRSEEEKGTFFWKVMGGDLRKWHIRDAEIGHR